MCSLPSIRAQHRVWENPTCLDRQTDRHTHTHTHTHTRIYIQIHTHTCICLYVYVCMYMFACIQVHPHSYAHMSERIRAHTRICLHVYRYTLTHTRTRQQTSELKKCVLLLECVLSCTPSLIRAHGNKHQVAASLHYNCVCVCLYMYVCMYICIYIHTYIYIYGRLGRLIAVRVRE